MDVDDMGAGTLQPHEIEKIQIVYVMPHNVNNSHQDEWKIDTNYALLGVYKRVIEMSELKVVWTMLNILGWSTYGYALFISFANVDVFTRTVLSFVGLLFLIAKLVVYCIASYRRHTRENLEIRKLRNEEKETELRQRERAIEAYDKETEIIKNFNNFQ
jgi:hypothetical protein